ncbi:MAG TPA: hypothetical protein VJZ71_21545 [Phycisphaerae bacterium]|nr:hypothetical protein [Phycisphaerae bacterium]
MRTTDTCWLLAGLVLIVSVGTLVARATYAQPMDDSQDPKVGQPAEAEDPPADDDALSSRYLRKLTKSEINRIRFLELRGMRLTQAEQPDRVTVKVPQAVVDDFLLEMQGEPDFSNEAARREFRKLTPPQKLHIIAKRKGEAYADKIEIQSDPEVFVEFRKHVMPTIIRGCAMAGCHAPGMEQETRFSLFKDPKKAANTTYANFVVLNELAVEEYPLINRSQPENSLLLSYMLPIKDVRPGMRHPGTEQLRPLYQSRNAPAYRRIERWIASLKHPKSDYGVRLLPGGDAPAREAAGPPTSQPQQQSEP